jgi:hypothetical protein
LQRVEKINWNLNKEDNMSWIWLRCFTIGIMCGQLWRGLWMLWFHKMLGIFWLLLPVVQQPYLGLGHLIVEVSRWHTDTTPCTTLLKEWLARRRDFYLTTHNIYRIYWLPKELLASEQEICSMELDVDVKKYYEVEMQVIHVTLFVYFCCFRNWH